MKVRALSDELRSEFICRVAATDEERALAFRLRFQVYCQECRYLDPVCYPDGLERDIFDDHAVHLLALDGAGEAVGSVRLVLPSPLSFPTQDYFSEWPARDCNCVAEVSRLIVAPAYRSLCG